MLRFPSVLRLAVACGVALASAAAAAASADLYGLGPAASAQAGAVAASVTDFSAAYYNPAGLAFDGATAVGVGAVGAVPRLRIQGRRFPLADQTGLLLGLRAPLPLGGVLAGRLTFALGLGLPPTSLLRIISRYPQEPFFPLYDNRAQRLMVLPALSVRLTDRLAVGVGFDYFAGLAGGVQGLTGASRAIEPRADEAIGARAGVHAGVRWDPWRQLSLAFAYRQKFSVPFSVTAGIVVAGSPLSLAVESEGLYTPDHFVWGVAYRPRPGTTLGLDVTWARWSAWGGPFIHVESTLPLAGDLVGELPAVPFSDTVAVHLGGEQRLPLGHRLELAVRAGYGFDQSPIPATQAGVTNLMDGPKHLATCGLGVKLRRVLPWTVTLDAHLGVQLVGHRTYTKRILGKNDEPDPFAGLRDEVKDNAADPATQGVQVSNPGYPSIGGGGLIVSGSVLLGVEL
jgi:long-subunit fatty acid transport protein